jgi:hypothetical protein
MIVSELELLDEAPGTAVASRLISLALGPQNAAAREQHVILPFQQTSGNKF